MARTLTPEEIERRRREREDLMRRASDDFANLGAVRNYGGGSAGSVSQPGRSATARTAPSSSFGGGGNAFGRSVSQPQFSEILRRAGSGLSNSFSGTGSRPGQPIDFGNILRQAGGQLRSTFGGRNGGQLDFAGGLSKFGSRVADNVLNRNLQKQGGDAFANYNAQKSMEDLMGGMPGAFNDDPLSFLSQARNAIGDGGMAEALSGIENRRADYERQQQRGDSRLAAMYDQLRNSILGDSETISGITDETQGRMSDIADREQEVLSGAHQATADRQNQILSNLGIEDAQAIAIARGDVQGQSANQSLERSATRDAAAQQYTASVGQNAQNLNTTHAAAAGLEGAERRSDLENQLQAAQARLQDEAAQTRAHYSAQNQQAAMNLAMQLYGAAQDRHNSQMSNWQNRFNMTQGLDDRTWDREMQLRNFDMQTQKFMADMQADQAQQNQGLQFQHLSPYQQMQMQLQQDLGPQGSANALSVLSNNMRGVGGRNPGYRNYDAVIDELVNVQGLPLPTAQAMAQQYLGMF